MWLGAALTVVAMAAPRWPPRWLLRARAKAHAHAPVAPPPRREARPPPPPAGWRPGHGELFPAERAILSPLRVGDPLGPGRVVAIAHHFEARVEVGVAAAGREVWLQVSRAAGSDVTPRARVGPFAVTALPGEAPEPVVGALVAALGAVLRPHVGMPVPPMMQPLRRAAR